VCVLQRVLQCVLGTVSVCRQVCTLQRVCCSVCVEGVLQCVLALCVFADNAKGLLRVSFQICRFLFKNIGLFYGDPFQAI